MKRLVIMLTVMAVALTMGTAAYAFKCKATVSGKLVFDGVDEFFNPKYRIKYVIKTPKAVTNTGWLAASSDGSYSHLINVPDGKFFRLVWVKGKGKIQTNAGLKLMKGQNDSTAGFYCACAICPVSIPRDVTIACPPTVL